MLSSPLVQIRVDESKDIHILTHIPAAENKIDLFSWKPPATSKADQLLDTLFFLRFIPSTSSNPNKVDRCHLSLCASPESLLFVDTETGILGLTSAISTASVFNISRQSVWNQQTPPSYTISVVGDYGTGNRGTLVLHKRSRRAAFVNLDAAADEPMQASITLQYIPLSPPIDGAGNKETRSVFLRLYNVGKGTFAVSKPNCAVGAATGADQGWDMFRLDRHPNETGGRLLGPRLTPLVMTAIGRKQSTLVLTSGNFLYDPSAEDDYLKVDLLRLDEKSVSRANAIALRTTKGYFSMLSVTNRSRDVTLISNKGSINEEWRLYLALPSETELRAPRVSITNLNKGIRRICSEIQLTTSLDFAFKVLTDYKTYSNFLEDCIESEIIDQHSPTDFNIRMVQTSTFLKLTIPTVSTMRVKLKPAKYRAEQSLISGSGIRHYEGACAIIPLTENRNARQYTGVQQCRVLTVVDVATSLPTPGFLVEGLLTNTTEQTLHQTKSEIERRANEA